jgi:prepilin-type processing-associated H-X9-DG protein
MRTNYSILKRYFAVAIILLSVSGVCQQEPSAAEKLAGKIPDGTIGFVVTSGIEQLRPSFNQSSMGQLWNDPNMQLFYSQIKSTLLDKIKMELEKSGDAQNKQIAATAVQFIKEVFECPMIAGIREVSAADPNQMPLGIFVILQAGKHKNALLPMIAEFEKETGQDQIIEKKINTLTLHTLKDAEEIPVYWGWCQDYFVLMVNDPKADTIKGLQTPSTTLKPTPLSKIKSSGDAMAIYCDIQKAAALVSRIAKPDNEEDLTTVGRIFKNLGLSTIKSFTMRAGFDRKDMTAQQWLEVPAPQTGLFTALKPVDMTMADMVDARATNLGILNIDFTVLYDVIWNTIQNAAPQEDRKEMQDAITEFETTNKISIRNGLFKSMDGRIAAYSIPAMVIPEIPGGSFALIAGLKDPALFNKTISDFIAAINPQTPDTQKSFQIRTQTLEGGQTMTICTIPQMALAQMIPNWVIVDNVVILTTNPALTQIAVKQISNPKSVASIRSVAAFRAKQAVLPSGTCFFQYSDTAVNAKQGLMQLQTLWPMAVNFAAGQGINLPIALPNIQSKLDLLGQSVEYAWLDSTGLHASYQGSGIEMSAGAIGGAAAGLAILMPALNKTKTTAQRVISGTNLKGIGTACRVYANDYEDKFPPSLDVLIKECDLDPKMLVSPRKPENFSEPSYIYITGQTTASSADNILAYEQPSFAKDGMINVLFADGHVAAMKKDEFMAEFIKTYKNLGRDMPDEPNGAAALRGLKQIPEPNQKKQK